MPRSWEPRFDAIVSKLRHRVPLARAFSDLISTLASPSSFEHAPLSLSRRREGKENKYSILNLVPLFNAKESQKVLAKYSYLLFLLMDIINANSSACNIKRLQTAFRRCPWNNPFELPRKWSPTIPESEFQSQSETSKRTAGRRAHLSARETQL